MFCLLPLSNNTTFISNYELILMILNNNKYFLQPKSILTPYFNCELIKAYIYVENEVEMLFAKWPVHFLPHASTGKVAFGSHQVAIAALGSTKVSHSSAKLWWEYVRAVWNKTTGMKSDLLTLDSIAIIAIFLGQVSTRRKKRRLKSLTKTPETPCPTHCVLTVWVFRCPLLTI